MDDGPTSFTKAQELRSFLLLSVVLAPLLAGIIVAGYGFLVWMYQLIVGLPGELSVVSAPRDVRHRTDLPATPEELHIASLVIHSTPKCVNDVADAIASLAGARVDAASCGGKLVVTLESPTADAMLTMIAGIQRIDGVLSAALVYQCVDSLEAMNEEIPDADA